MPASLAQYFRANSSREPLWSVKWAVCQARFQPLLDCPVAVVVEVEVAAAVVGFAVRMW